MEGMAGAGDPPPMLYALGTFTWDYICSDPTEQTFSGSSPSIALLACALWFIFIHWKGT